MPPGSAILAHQGGWDEALFVVVPMAVLLALLAIAQRRAVAEHEAEHEGGEETGAGHEHPTARPPEQDS